MSARAAAALPAVGSAAPDFTLPSRPKSVLVGPEGLVRWAYAEDTPSSRRENRELLAQLETHQRSV